MSLHYWYRMKIQVKLSQPKSHWVSGRQCMNEHTVIYDKVPKFVYTEDLCVKVNVIWCILRFLTVSSYISHKTLVSFFFCWVRPYPRYLIYYSPFQYLSFHTDSTSNFLFSLKCSIFVLSPICFVYSFPLLYILPCILSFLIRPNNPSPTFSLTVLTLPDRYSTFSYTWSRSS